MKDLKAIKNSKIFMLLIFILIFLSTCQKTDKQINLNRVPELASFASYNHTALVVKDLDSSVAFYHYIFNFDTINYPFPYREHIRAKWLSIGHNAELHLGEFIGDTTQYYYPGHIGFTVKSIDSIFSRLLKLNYTLPQIENMPNGERTIHITDIDSNNIHIIESK